MATSEIQSDAEATLETLDEVVTWGAALAWLGLGTYVAAYDYYAIRTGKETLSGAYWRALKHRRGRWPVLLAAVSVFKHLVLPWAFPKADPLMVVAERWHRSASSSR